MRALVAEIQLERRQRDAEALRQRELDEQRRALDEQRRRMELLKAQMQQGTEQSAAEIEALQAQITQSEAERGASARRHADMERRLAQEKADADARLQVMQEKARREAEEQTAAAQAEIVRARAEAEAKEHQLLELERRGQISQSCAAAEKRAAEEQIAALQTKFQSADEQVYAPFLYVFYLLATFQWSLILFVFVVPTQRQRIEMEKAELQAAQARDRAETERVRQQRLESEQKDRESQDQMAGRLTQLLKQFDKLQKSQQQKDAEIAALKKQLVDALTPQLPETVLDSNPSSSGLARSTSADAVHGEFLRAGIDSASAVQYCKILSEQGYGTPKAFNTLGAQRLLDEPLSFKRGHVELLQKCGDKASDLAQFLEDNDFSCYYDSIKNFLCKDKCVPLVIVAQTTTHLEAIGPPI